MNTYEEIKIQNKCTEFYSMFYNLSTAIRKRCGENIGEGIIRRAVRAAGEELGRKILEEHRKAGIKTNIHNLYHYGLDILFDPRVRKYDLFDFEDRQNFEIHTCPFAQYHLVRKAGKQGSFFCDEFQYAVIRGYTDNYGQLNLSNMLTYERDNFCCVAAFFRPANAPYDRIKEAFTTTEPLSDLIPVEPDIKVSKGSIANFVISMYCHLYNEAVAKCGSEGECSVADGLKAWAKEALEMMPVQASHTGLVMDDAFVKLNFPISLYDDPTENWENDTTGKAREILKALVLDNIHGSLK